MQIDIYLGFTSCQGNCIFCRKGDGLVHFPRPNYMQQMHIYKFFHFPTVGDTESIFDQDLSTVNSINISGNDPVSWNNLAHYVQRLRNVAPIAILTLRISNTHDLPIDMLPLFDKFEFSIYGQDESIHNNVIGSDNAWRVLQKNIQLFRDHHILDKIFFQTIFLHENIDYMKEILSLMREISYKENPIKIIYPYFMPVADAASLPHKSKILKKLFVNMGSKFLLDNCHLVNFSIPINLKGYFRGYSD